MENVTTPPDRNFRGVWIPREIWCTDKLSMVEKFLYTEIESLDMSERHCYATNQYFAQFLGCSIPTITRAIKKLKLLGYIKIETKRSYKGTERTILALIKLIKGGCQNDDSTANQNDEHINTSYNNTIIDIVLCLNTTCGKNYKPTTQHLKRIITARLKEGFTYDDFKKVITTKSKQWRDNKDFSKYLRPETLFSASHFDSYLNEDDKIHEEHKIKHCTKCGASLYNGICSNVLCENYRRENV
jgi:uncharacterized phage protein (TIGR02220 family)